MGGLNPPPLILLVAWISNIGFCVPGNRRINANMVNILNLILRVNTDD